jgi:hypothetical protein
MSAWNALSNGWWGATYFFTVHSWSGNEPVNPEMNMHVLDLWSGI